MESCKVEFLSRFSFFFLHFVISWFAGDRVSSAMRTRAANGNWTVRPCILELKNELKDLKIAVSNDDELRRILLCSCKVNLFHVQYLFDLRKVQKRF